MKCIVHLTTSFGCGGLERVIANLLHASSKDEFKHVVISLSNDVSFAYALPDNIELYTVNKKPGLDLHAHIRVLKILKNLDASVLHTYNFGTLEYHYIAKFFVVNKSIHTDHGLGGDDPNGKNRKHNIFRKITSYIIDDYIVVSNDLKKWVTNTVGVSPKKVHFVFNGVPVLAPQKLKPKISGVLKLVIIGRLAEVKNHKRLIRCLSIMQETHPSLNISCDIVGDGPLMDDLKKQRDSMINSDAIIFHGNQKNVNRFLKNSDALILTSSYEAMPMTVLEAMVACRAVICPDVGGVSDFINHDDVNLIKGNDDASLIEAIVSLCESTHLEYENKIKDAYVKVKELYSVDSMYLRYLEFYKK